MNSLNTVFPLIEALYGITPDTDTFEEVALVAWDLIGNKHTRLYRYVADSKNQQIKLPCNADIIESVSVPMVDAQYTSNRTDFGNPNAVFVEKYIDYWKKDSSPFATKGKLISYKLAGGILYLDGDYKNVTVIYHGVLMDDEDNLPLINDKEARAIAAFVAYRQLYKEGLMKRDKNTLQIAKDVEQEWLRRCNAARIVEHLSQNDANMILDAKYREDRKFYGKTYKGII